MVEDEELVRERLRSEGRTSVVVEPSFDFLQFVGESIGCHHWLPHHPLGNGTQELCRRLLVLFGSRGWGDGVRQGRRSLLLEHV